MFRCTASTARKCVVNNVQQQVFALSVLLLLAPNLYFGLEMNTLLPLQDFCCIE